MRLKVLGAAGTVTGSSYVLTATSGCSIMIDLGMFQGPQVIEALNFLPYDYDCRELAGVVVTHAHLDHCGRLPMLLKLGFTGQIWMSPATRDLVALALFDSAKIAKFDQDKALYDRELVEATLEQCHTRDYHTPIKIADFEITFRDAGHLLGASIVEITDTSATTGPKKIVFSGDLGNYPGIVLSETERVETADVVVMESTYGDRLHTEHNALEALQQEINAVESSGGALLIPSFAMEKTQELLFMIGQLKKQGKVGHQTPVFLDSPMAQKATTIYLQYPHLLNPQLQQEINSGDPFSFPGLEVVVKHHQSQGIRERAGAKVIIAGGGMMTGGRILSHAQFYLKNPVNRIFFVGYQGEETLGRAILEGNSPVTIDKTSVHVTANVGRTQAMSSHSDQQQLLDWLSDIDGVGQVILTHGDDSPRQALAERIRTELHIEAVRLPMMNEELEL